MVYDNPHISGKSDPLYTLNNQGLFFAQLQYQFLPETKHDNYSPNSPNLPEKNNQKQISHGKIQTAGCKALGFSNCRATCIWKDPNIKIQWFFSNENAIHSLRFFNKTKVASFLKQISSGIPFNWFSHQILERLVQKVSVVCAGRYLNPHRNCNRFWKAGKLQIPKQLMRYPPGGRWSKIIGPDSRLVTRKGICIVRFFETGKRLKSNPRPNRQSRNWRKVGVLDEIGTCFRFLGGDFFGTLRKPSTSCALVEKGFPLHLRCFLMHDSMTCWGGSKQHENLKMSSKANGESSFAAYPPCN